MSSEAIGIDIGGTKTALARVALPEAKIVERREIATPPREASGQPFLEELAMWVGRLAAEDLPIGVGICELVGPEGAMASAHRVDWRGLDLHRAFASRKLALLPDVRAAALAEARCGAGRPYRDFVYVNAGTGLSSTWVRDGLPHAGAHGAALVLGTGVLPFTCPHCGSHHLIAPESIAGAGAVLGHYRDLGGKAGTARDVLDRAKEGDAFAVEAVTRAAEQAGAAAGWLVNVVDPEAVVVGGGLAAAGGVYWAHFVKSLHRTRWTAAPRALPVHAAGLGASAGVIGAAAAALAQFS